MAKMLKLKEAPKTLEELLQTVNTVGPEKWGSIVLELEPKRELSYEEAKEATGVIGESLLFLASVGNSDGSKELKSLFERLDERLESPEAYKRSIEESKKTEPPIYNGKDFYLSLLENLKNVRWKRLEFNEIVVYCKKRTERFYTHLPSNIYHDGAIIVLQRIRYGGYIGISDLIEETPRVFDYYFLFVVDGKQNEKIVTTQRLKCEHIFAKILYEKELGTLFNQVAQQYNPTLKTPQQQD